LKNDIHGSSNAKPYQQLGGPKPILVFQMIGYHRLPRDQRVTRRRLDVGTDRSHTNDFRSPADTCRDQKSGLLPLIFQNLTKFSFESFGS